MAELEEEVGDEMVARRLVFRREVWDELVHLADALRERRGIEVTPTDVAAIAIEAGLAEVRTANATTKKAINRAAKKTAPKGKKKARKR